MAVSRQYHVSLVTLLSSFRLVSFLYLLQDSHSFSVNALLILIPISATMGFFDSIQKPGFTAAKGKNIHIKQEIVKTALNSQKTLVPFPQHSKKRSLSDKKTTKVNSHTGKPSPKSRTQNPRKRPASTPQRLESDSDDVSDQELGDARKRARRNSDVEPDQKRQIRSRMAFSEEDGREVTMVHAIDVASLKKPTRYKAAFPNDPQAIQIHLQYPSASQCEKYAFR